MRKARNTSKKRWSCTNIKQEIQSGAATMCMMMLLLMTMLWKVYTESSTEDNSGYVDEETINNGVRKTVDVTIAGVTDKVPTCYNGYGNTSLLFMNQKGFESLWADGKSGNELKPGNAIYSAYVVAENADEYQDTLEKETEENPEYSQISFYVSNMDKQMRDEKITLYTAWSICIRTYCGHCLNRNHKYHQYLKHRNGA